MRKFKDYLKIKNEAFTHSSDIPTEFAMAVYKVMHNQADLPEWNIMDKYPRAKALGWIMSILRSNSVPENELKKEMDWWQKQLTTVDN